MDKKEREELERKRAESQAWHDARGDGIQVEIIDGMIVGFDIAANKPGSKNFGVDEPPNDNWLKSGS